jgi:hypothetical protein
MIDSISNIRYTLIRYTNQDICYIIYNTFVEWLRDAIDRFTQRYSLHSFGDTGIRHRSFHSYYYEYDTFTSEAHDDICLRNTFHIYSTVRGTMCIEENNRYQLQTFTTRRTNKHWSIVYDEYSIYEMFSKYNISFNELCNILHFMRLQESQGSSILIDIKYHESKYAILKVLKKIKDNKYHRHCYKYISS